MTPDEIRSVKQSAIALSNTYGPMHHELERNMLFGVMTGMLIELTAQMAEIKQILKERQLASE